MYSWAHNGRRWYDPCDPTGSRIDHSSCSYSVRCWLSLLTHASTFVCHWGGFKGKGNSQFPLKGLKGVVVTSIFDLPICLYCADGSLRGSCSPSNHSLCSSCKDLASPVLDTRRIPIPRLVNLCCHPCYTEQVYEKNLHDTMAEFPELRKQRRRDYYRRAGHIFHEEPISYTAAPVSYFWNHEVNEVYSLVVR